MNKIACIICKEIIAEVDFETLSLPLTAEQFLSPMPRNEVPPPFQPGLDVQHWACPFCRSYPIRGYDAGLDSIPYVLLEWSGNKFNEVIVDDIISARERKQKSIKEMEKFVSGLIGSLKTQKPVIKKHKKVYKCKTCGAKFNHRSSLSRHKKTKGHK